MCYAKYVLPMHYVSAKPINREKLYNLVLSSGTVMNIAISAREKLIHLK
jgi:hypothetical protein